MTVTDADRRKAWSISEHCVGGARCAALDDGRCDCGVDELREDIAAALAETREKALAPFLALADKAEQDGARASFRDFAGNPWPAHIYPHDIRRAAEVTSSCARCKGHGWTGPNDPRPGVTCDDCDGAGTRPRHDHSWAEDRIGSGDRAHLRDQVCIVCRERRTVAS